MKTKEEIFSLIKEILDEKLAIAEIEESQYLKDDLGLDSLDMAEFLVEFDRRLHSYIPDEEANGLETISDFLEAGYKYQETAI